MNFDRIEFIAWMNRIITCIELLKAHITQLHRGIQRLDDEELLDNQDVLQMLKISNRSLQRYRTAGALPYYTISGKIYYKSSDVQAFIRERFNEKRKNKENKK
jgi:hypothetical protein